MIDYNEWYPLKGYEGLYEITKTGLLRSIGNKKSIASCMGKTGSTILKPSTCGRYDKIGLMVNKKRKYHSIHKLVANTFIDNPYNKETVNHINGNKKDNRVENLEWLTIKENINHYHKNKKK